MRTNQRCIAQRSVSESTRSPSAVEPTTSAKMMVTTLRRSPVTAATETGAPHAGQKREPSGMRAPQREHVFTAQV